MAALADGSLAPERRAALAARVAASPELAERLAEQERAVALTRSAAAEVEAPPALRGRIGQRGARRAATPRRIVAVGSAVAVVLAVVVALSVFRSGTRGEDSARLSLPPVSRPAPAARRRSPRRPRAGGSTSHATGLPRRDGRRFYEAWLRSPAGVLVPIGTFNEGRKVTLWAGVSPKDYPSLTVTRESADGDQASSGEKVLVGTVDSGR